MALAGGGGAAIAIAPRGDAIVFSGRRSGRRELFLRRLPGTRAAPLPDTEGARSPFVSPDGRRIAFFASDRLAVTSLDGGPVRTLCAAPAPAGGAWDGADGIVFASAGTLKRVSARGGRPQLLAQPDAAAGERALAAPAAHPGGALLVEVQTAAGARIDALSPEPGRRLTVVTDARRPRLARGRLVFERAGDLLSAPLDAERLELTAPATRLARGVLGAGDAPAFDVAADGSLVWAARTGTRGLWLDRKGRSRVLAAIPESARALHLSPDGRRALALVAEDRLLAVDLRSGAATTLASGVSGAVWSDAGRGVVLARRVESGALNLFRQAAQPGRRATRLTWSPRDQHPTSWSDRARAVVFDESRPEGGRDVVALLLGETLETRALAAGAADERGGRLSPDGRWLAYVSDRTGRDEVYLRPYPVAAPETRISRGGGTAPAWSRDGSELLFLSGGRVMAVETAGAVPRPLCEAPGALQIDAAPSGLLLVLDRRGLHELRLDRRRLAARRP